MRACAARVGTARVVVARACALLACSWLICAPLCAAPASAPAAPASAPATQSSPLLELARDTLADDHAPEGDDDSDAAESPPMGDGPVRAMAHEIAQARVPPDAECARGLGAPRFAQLHERMGHARVAIGDFEGAAASFRSACACRPRSADLLANLAGVLFALRDYDGARVIIDQGLQLDARSPDLYRLAGFVDFVTGRWADATARFRYVAAGDPSRMASERAQLLYWLAQRRAGVAQPQFVERFHENSWPRPLMRFLAGDTTESNIVRAVKADRDYSSEDEYEYGVSTAYILRRRLVQALFYVGESHWARGDPALAREYLTAAISLRAVELPEHQLARAEIAKLR